MKIGIITYHRAKNIGAMLQAYALQTTLESLGQKVEIIDYRNNQMEYNYKVKKVFECKGIKNKIKNILTKNKNIKYETIRNNFIKDYYHLSKKRYDNNNIKLANKEYDAFITGSDQVWNLRLNYNDMTYFLDFAEKPRYSYAASFGANSIEKDDENRIKKELIKYSDISIREYEGKQIIEKLLPTNRVKITLDPTLLLAKDKWIALAKEPKRKINNEYIFIYLIAPSKYLIEQAYILAKKYNYKLVCFHNGYRKYKNMINLNSLSPNEFIYYINNASLILTSSFHGLCFSILLNKKFYYSLDKNKNNNNSRLSSLSKMLELDSRNIESNTPASKEINYKKVNLLLDDERKKSMEYINNIIRKRSNKRR